MPRPPHIIIAAILLLPPGMAAAQTGAARERQPDRAITEAVEDELYLDDAVPFNRIDVATREGIVTLTGTVGDILAKERATRLAASVRGVTAVINHLEVKPPRDIADRVIASRVREALAANPATDAYAIAVQVDDGKVTLTGTVDSFQERLLAGKVAQSVTGVRALENNLDVAFTEQRTDAEIADDIRQPLAWDTRVDAGLLEVRVNGGRVVLSGTVGSAAERIRAINEAHVTGVRAVDATRLEVDSRAREAALLGDTHRGKSDQAVEHAIEQALRLDPQVDPVDIRVRVEQGTVTLRGTVDSLRARQRAESLARSRAAVRRVRNRLKVRPEQRLTDREIARSVRQALLRDPYVERFAIEADVNGGTVFLDGTVNSPFEKQQAAEVAAALEGVEAVENNLAIGQRPADAAGASATRGLAGERALAEEIRDRLSWNPYVDAEEVEVEVENGVAVLTGTVDSPRESEAASASALKGGARAVINNLEVARPPGD